MTVTQGILLGLLQGVAEFLPISSSGHLVAAQRLFALDDVPLLFDVALHVATLAAVIAFFHRRVWALLCAFGRWIARRPLKDEGGVEAMRKDADDRRCVQAVIVATLFTGAIGIAVQKALPAMSVRFVCAMFLVTAGVLVLPLCAATATSASAEVGGAKRPVLPRLFRRGDGEHGLNAPLLRQAVIIGIAQGAGTLPGISRSGITITAALLCGLSAEAAGEFSFIVSIPAILGAFVLQLHDASQTAVLAAGGIAPVAAGAAAAAAAGGLSLAFLMRVIKQGRLAWFAAYLVPAGIAGLIYFGG